MDIVVCMKQTFDTEAKIMIEDGKISEQEVSFIVNPYDEYAIEEAISLRDELGGTVTVVCVGKERVQEAVRTALAMGADEAIIVREPADPLDSAALSEVLYAVIKNLSFDLILAGNQSVDDGSSQVAVRLAELLSIGHVSTVIQLEVDGRHVVAHRDAEGNTEVVEGNLPLLITAQQGLNEPRYPSLLGIRKAAKKPITYITLEDLGLAGKLEKKTTTVDAFLPQEKKAGFILEGELTDQVNSLVQQLHEVNKVL